MAPTASSPSPSSGTAIADPPRGGACPTRADTGPSTVLAEPPRVLRDADGSLCTIAQPMRPSLRLTATRFTSSALRASSGIWACRSSPSRVTPSPSPAGWCSRLAPAWTVFDEVEPDARLLLVDEERAGARVAGARRLGDHGACELLHGRGAAHRASRARRAASGRRRGARAAPWSRRAACSSG